MVAGLQATAYSPYTRSVCDVQRRCSCICRLWRYISVMALTLVYLLHYIHYFLTHSVVAFCSHRDEHVLAMALTIPLCVFVTGVTIVVVMVLRRHVARVQQKNLQLTAKITGVVECEVSPRRL